MATSTKQDVRRTALNLPNQLTAIRLVLAIVLFALMMREAYLASLCVFLVAAGTDWLDGYFARRWGLVTTLGRILDPFADKIIICGTFIFIVAAADPGLHALGFQAWVVVLVVGRELLVTALRSFLEQQGADFSAATSGKLKMVAQCAAAALALLYLDYAEPAQAPQWLDVALPAAIWATVLLTAYSGVAYVRSAIRLLSQ